MDDPLIEQVRQGQLLFVQSLDVLRQEPLHPCPEACETGDVQSPRFQRRGHLGRVDLIEAMDAAATHHKGTDGEAGPNVQPTRALWAEQCLVSGEAEDIRPQCLHVDGPRACGLGRVHDKRKAVFFRKSRDERKVGQVSGHVRGVGHGHKAGVWAEKPFELVVAQLPGVVHLHEADLCPLLPQAVEGRSTELCSQTVVMTWSPGRTRPESAVFSACVTLAAKAMQSGLSAWRSVARASRAW